MNEIDQNLLKSLESILNIQLNAVQWNLCTLPIIHGGIGIRRISDLALPAFLASVNGCKNLVSQTLQYMDIEISIYHEKEAMDLWTNLNGDKLPAVPYVQKNWDLICISRIIDEEVLPSSNSCDAARLLALRELESGAWLQAIPSVNIGTFLDAQTFRTCAALRLGCNIFKRHVCHCNSIVLENGHHGLSCPQSKGRIPRHNELNSIIHRALTSINIAACREPNDLDRDDGKRPDGVTLVPWSKGQRLVWDATCVDTLAESYVQKSKVKAGAAAEIACKRKHEKYTTIEASHFIFKALAFETLGPWAEETKSFINEIGSILIKESGDLRAKHYLYQRLSLAIQRGNAASILGTLPNSIPMDEIYFL